MEKVFGAIVQGGMDTRLVKLSGRVILTRSLGSILFLGLQNITDFKIFAPNFRLESPPLLTSNNGQKLDISPNDILQTILKKTDFKGEIGENDTIDCSEGDKVKKIAHKIHKGNSVDILGNMERNNLGQFRVNCEWLKITSQTRLPPDHKYSQTSFLGTDFQGDVPLCQFTRRGIKCKLPKCNFRHEFKDERERTHSEKTQKKRKEVLEMEKDANNPHPPESMKYKRQRADLFVTWFLQKFGKKLESLNPPNIMDVAGGKGIISVMLLDKGFNCILVEPRDNKVASNMKRYNSTMKGNFSHHQCNLDDSFINSEEGKKAIKETDIIIAMHPDEATEATIDLALSHKKPFAVVPCCVFPSLFPRKNKQGKSVITYFDFIDYLLEKDEDIKVDYLDFKGRCKILYKI